MSPKQKRPWRTSLLEILNGEDGHVDKNERRRLITELAKIEAIDAQTQAIDALTVTLLDMG